LQGSGNALLPGQNPDDLVLAERLEGHTFELEGQALVAVYSNACPTTAVAPALPRDAGVFADAPLTVASDE
jgi:hypothetical protein